MAEKVNHKHEAIVKAYNTVNEYFASRAGFNPVQSAPVVAASSSPIPVFTGNDDDLPF